MDFKDIIKKHLDKMAQQDFAFAERYKLESKTLDGCCKYITSQAQKQKKSGGVWIEDAVVYGWAVHYYMEDDVKPEPIKGSVKIGHVGGDMKPSDVAETKITTTEETTIKGAEIKTIKKTTAVVKDKRDNKCVELDLFGGF